MKDDAHISVTTPEKWMNGWDNIYKKMLEANDDELFTLNVSRPISHLIHSLQFLGKTLTDIKALELASGDGRVATFLAKNKINVTCIEALPNAIRLGKRISKIHKVNDRIKFHLGDIGSWPIPVDEYDIIITLQCLQYLFNDAISRLEDILSKIKPGGFFVYSGNILPHFETDPPIRFITQEELESALENWNIHMIGSDKALLKKDDVRGYVWVVAQKPEFVISK